MNNIGGYKYDLDTGIIGKSLSTCQRITAELVAPIVKQKMLSGGLEQFSEVK